ncbi:MAG: hypothetical protein N2712_06635 [Brevinematales bacterium]|nr:hypothetical protein [Brevinematales bacterium]
MIFRSIFLGILMFLTFCGFVYPEPIKNISDFSFPKRTGKEVLVLVSDKISTFEEVEKGIYDSLQGYNVFSYNFHGDTNQMKMIPDVVNRLRPNVVVAVGISVLENLIGKVQIPVVFSMVINYKKFGIEKYNNITGVSLQVPPESIFFNFKTVYPNFRKVGVICSKDYFNLFIQPSVDSVKFSLDVEIVPVLIPSSKDFVSAYNSLSKNVDVMWMVPDTTVLDKNSIVYFITESYKFLKPTIVYSEPFVKAGGLFSVSPNYSSVGSQVALMVRKIVEDKVQPSKIEIAPVVGTFTTINRELARKLNINESLLGLIDNVVE